MTNVDWQLTGTLIGTMSALVGVPLTAIILYLRAIREDQRSSQSVLNRRTEKIEAECKRIDASIEQAERRYATKEEWIRETMLARSQLGRLTELMARLQAELESSRGLATQFVRATNAIIELTERLARRIADTQPGGTDHDGP
ncbi:MAG: Atg14 domain-containing protein [Phycisphaerales bacterium]|nr:Atg14 domain-containing protein [Phycisphaerales bacterium]